jgi:hypothetical protein
MSIPDDTDHYATPPAPAGIGKLAAALAKAQGEIKGAAKAKDNPFFKSKYADLAAVWDACREALAKNCLAVIQPTIWSPTAGLFLRTILAHESGETIEGDFPVKPVQDTPQGLGSALTYARRYSLASMVGVAPEGEDDDGNAGSHGATKDKGPPAQLGKKSLIADKPLSAKQREWIDAACRDLETMAVNQALDWEIVNQEALDRLKAHNTEAWNRVHGMIVDRTADPATGEREPNHG